MIKNSFRLKDKALSNTPWLYMLWIFLVHINTRQQRFSFEREPLKKKVSRKHACTQMNKITAQQPHQEWHTCESHWNKYKPSKQFVNQANPEA